MDEHGYRRLDVKEMAEIIKVFDTTVRQILHYHLVSKYLSVLQLSETDENPMLETINTNNETLVIFYNPSVVRMKSNLSLTKS